MTTIEFEPGRLLQAFLADGGWRRADSIVDDIDNRVLIVGPGPDSGHGEVTNYAEALLTNRRMHPQRLPRGAADEVVARASTVPFVLCLVCTVGTASETSLLLSKIVNNQLSRNGMRPRVVVVIPSAYRDAHFASTAREVYETTVVDCATFAAGDALGLVILRCLFGPIVAAADARVARANSAMTQGLDDSARRALEPVPPPSPGGVRVVVTLGAIFLLDLIGAAFALTIAPESSRPFLVPLAVIVAVVVLALGALMLVADGRAIPPALESILGKAIHALRIVGSRRADDGTKLEPELEAPDRELEPPDGE